MAQPSFAGLPPSRIVSEPRREHVQRLDLDRQLLAQRREVAPVDGHEQTADAQRARPGLFPPARGSPTSAPTETSVCRADADGSIYAQDLPLDE